VALAWPRALEFVRWLHAGAEPSLALGTRARSYRFHRL